MNRKVMIKRALFLSLGLGLFASSFAPVFAEEDLPSRAIAVVYDDSGSMYKNYATDTPVDTWSQAKYAMEVFAGMLNPDDSMEIYYMSDYSRDGSKSGPRITLDGSDPAKSNIKKIHQEKTSSADTPFETVEAAYEGLEKSDAEEKWLVILTDGEFRSNDETQESKEQLQKTMDAFYENKDEDINVIFLAMGPEAIPIAENLGEDIYVEKAADSSQILEKLTDVSHRVFNMNSLNVDRKTGTFTLDVPSSSLTVFVQGDGARIKDLVDENGRSMGTRHPEIAVAATSSSDNTEHPDNRPDEELEGEIAVFEGDFPPGTYMVEAKNARTIEVYYKPDLAVTAYLTTADGARIDDLSELPTGDYVIHFGLVSGLDKTPLDSSSSVFHSEDSVEYKATIKNNGKPLDQVFQDGDTLHVEQGNLDIDVTANYLKYNHSNTHLNYDIWSEKNVDFAFDKNGSHWSLGGGHISSEEPFTVTMTVEGKAPTGEEWAALEIPQAAIETANGAVINTPVVTKDSTPGLFNIVPDPEQNKFTQIDYSQSVPVLKLSLDQEVGGIPWKGSGQSELTIQDKRIFWEKDKDWPVHSIGWLLGGLALLVILVGYIPGFKKQYLPKMTKMPKIQGDPKNPRVDDEKVEFGSIQIDTVSTLMPYMKQTASIRYVPGSVSRFPKLQVRAVENRSRMEVTNPQAFKNKEVFIGSKKVEELIPAVSDKAGTSAKAGAPKSGHKKAGKKTKKNTTALFGPGTTIKAENDTYIYQCKLNQPYKKGGKKR